METTVKYERINKQAILRLSEQLVEPCWLREHRLHALEHFNRMPWPTGKEEEWRKTKIHHFQGENFPVPEDGFSHLDDSNGFRFPTALNWLLGKESSYAGLLAKMGQKPVYRHLSEEAKDRNVLVSDLPTAVREHSEWVKPLLNNRETNVPNGKLEALHEAFWNTGTFVRIPQNAALEKPIVLLTHFSGMEESVFPQTLIAVEPNSRTQILEIVTSEMPASRLAVNRRVKILAADGAQIDYFLLLLNSGDETAYSSLMAVGQRNSSVHMRVFQLGGHRSKTHVQADLTGEGASAAIQGLYFADETQQMDFNTIQNHFKSFTESNLLFKGAVGGQARAAYRGMIQIVPQAQETNAYQLNKNLLLSREAHVDSNPVLEIEANDVRCSHGATTGPVDRDELFYLQSRGLPLKMAQRLIVEGYFNEIISLLPFESLREVIRQAIDQKIELSDFN